MLSGAIMSSERIGCGKAFAAAITFKVHLGTRPLGAFAQACCGVGGKLSLGTETFSALLAVVLFLGKVETKVVLHCQSVWVCRVAHIAVVLSNFVEILMVGQAASMTVGLSTLLTRERSPSTFSWIKFLRS